MSGDDAEVPWSGDPAFCLYGALNITHQLDLLEGHTEGVQRNDDIEHVHKTRVTTRRIRVAMAVFRGCFPRKRFNRWGEGIREVTRALGNARDTDVQIAFLEGVLKESRGGRARPGVRLLLNGKRDARVSMQSVVVEALDAMDASSVVDEIRLACADISRQWGGQGLSSASLGTYLGAHHHITQRLDSLLELEGCVHEEGEADRHHRMRIAAKRLRYTMELFNPLYEDHLAGQLETVKQLQDVLGEMHDADVWISYVPDFTEELASELVSGRLGDAGPGRMASVERDLERFLDEVTRRRAALYRDFVKLWEATRGSRMFEELRRSTSLEGVLASGAAKRLALISDVHGNIHALRAVMKDARKRGATVFINAGDLVGHGAHPEEVIDEVRANHFLGVAGNFDVEALKAHNPRKAVGGASKRAAVSLASVSISKEARNYLKSQPRELRLVISGSRLLVTHGSPESIEEHIRSTTPDARLQELAAGADADVIVMGHTHEQFRREVGGTVFVNPGSVGRPGDGDPRAAYALLTMGPLSIELIRVAYDAEAAADAIRKRGMPEEFAQMVLWGLGLEAVKERDRSRGRASRSGAGAQRMLKGVADVALKYDPDPPHSAKVRTLSLVLFDGLRAVHGMGGRERLWLEFAAMLHDIGWARVQKGHDKAALRMVLNEEDLPLTIKERYIVGSIARYHRKRTPKDGDYNLAPLEARDLRIVEGLSAIMRVADALDASHQGEVVDLKVRVGSGRTVLACLVSGSVRMEREALQEKKNLFEEVFGMALSAEWRRARKVAPEGSSPQ